MTTVNLKNGADLPIMQQLAVMPYSYNYSGGCYCFDGKRYIYWLVGYATTSFYRYDLWTDGWMQLGNCPSTPSSSYASAMVYDRSRNWIFCAVSGGTSFYYYQVNGNVWSAALAVLPMEAEYGATLEHTCPVLNPAGNDNNIYYSNGDETTQNLYCYSISGNTWATLGSNMIPSTPGPASMLYWMYGWDPDKILIMKGNGSRTCYLYSIGGNNIAATISLLGSGSSVNTGSCSAYAPNTNELFWIESGTRDLVKTKLNPQGILATGANDSATVNTLTDSSQAWNTDTWYGMYVTITSGTGIGQTRQIIGNTSNTLEVYPNWTTSLDTTSNYVVKSTVLAYGKATAAAASTLTDTTQTWLVNSFQYQMVTITSGTGAGQSKYISSNTATQVTVSGTWTTTPDTTSTYEIQGFVTTAETAVPYATSSTYYGNTMAVAYEQGLTFVYFSRKGAQTDWFRYLTLTP